MTASEQSYAFGGFRRNLSWQLDRAYYFFAHWLMVVMLSPPLRVWHRILSMSRLPAHSKNAQKNLITRYRHLLHQDVENVAQGYYQRDLLDFPFRDYTQLLPALVGDFPRVFLRKLLNRYQELPQNENLAGYPHYYTRNFHWQTDGWLSDRSARLYDAQVEFLFTGAADVMRRMAIPPLVQSLQQQTQPIVVDIGCGTGRFLRQVGQSLPHAQLLGVDLSPAYVRHAQTLASLKATIYCENAEALSLADESVDAATSVFLFHELPKAVRRQVAAEIWRVLKPGGQLIICDSAQLVESSDLSEFLGDFARLYHEPYYQNYLQDDLEKVLADSQFTVLSTRAAYLSKIVVAQKPAHILKS